MSVKLAGGRPALGNADRSLADRVISGTGWTARRGRDYAQAPAVGDPPWFVNKIGL